MPNWCEGSLKLRGKSENILRFINEGLNVYKDSSDTPIDKKDWLRIVEVGDKCLEIYFDKDTIYVEGTQRAFVNNRYSSNLHFTDCITIHKDSDDEICCLAVSQAWAFRDEDWIEIAKKYGLTVKLYGIEQGMGFVEDILLTDNGKTVGDNSPSYADYKDFVWNCPIPWLGG